MPEELEIDTDKANRGHLDVRTRMNFAARHRAVVAPLLAMTLSCAPLHLGSTGEVRELTRDQQVKQAFNRLAFGPDQGDIARVTGNGVDTWIVQQLNPGQIADPAVDSILSEFVTQRRSVRELVDSFPPQDVFIRELRKQRGIAAGANFSLTSEDSMRFKQLNDRGNYLAQQIPAAKLARSVFTERQLLEVMTDFWENHFSVYNAKMPTRFSLLEYDRDVIRPHALGKFRDLLEAVAKSPEMLYYLDNWQSQADSLHLTLPEVTRIASAKSAADSSRVRSGARKRRQGINENFGRELLELHTLGVDGGYTQQDIIGVARALTGWTINDPRAGGGFVFRPALHDAEAKVILGHHLPAGRGIEDGEEVLDMLARQPATARFIATKLVRFFVDDVPPSSLVDKAAATFARTDGDISQVMLTIATSPEFYSRTYYRRKVKTPFELVVSTLRVMGAQPDTTARTARLPATLGQPVFGRLTPDGWPDNSEAWINSGSMLSRINFGSAAASGRVPGISLQRWAPARALATQPDSTQVDGVVDAILEGEASPETRQVLVEGRNPVATSTSITAMTAPTRQAALSLLVGLALGAPEFQRR